MDLASAAAAGARAAPRDSHESAVGRLEQPAEVGRIDPALS